jgi:hypothetical protein
MKILSGSLQGYTNTQSSTIGWKEICCSKTSTAQFQSIPTIRLNIATGNPEFYFTTYLESCISNGNIGFYGPASGQIQHVRGFKVATNGVVSIPGGAVDIIPYAQSWNLIDFPYSSYSTDTRNVYFNSRSSEYSTVNTQMCLSVYSERIDLITLTCV